MKLIDQVVFLFLTIVIKVFLQMKLLYPLSCEKYLKQMYLTFVDFTQKQKYDELLNLLNYFETIILSKEISNSIINTSFIKLFIDFLDINNDKIRIRSCSIIASLIRYATNMEKSLDQYNLQESLISFISENNNINLSFSK